MTSDGFSKRAGLSEEFVYRGAVDRAGKLEFLRSLDVLSVPATYDEPKGMFLLEAMASGVPVVQPRRGAFTEVVEKTGGGLLVEPDSPEALADGLHRMWSDRQLRRQPWTEGLRRRSRPLHDCAIGCSSAGRLQSGQCVRLRPKGGLESISRNDVGRGLRPRLAESGGPRPAAYRSVSQTAQSELMRAAALGGDQGVLRRKESTPLRTPERFVTRTRRPGPGKPGGTRLAPSSSFVTRHEVCHGVFDLSVSARVCRCGSRASHGSCGGAHRACCRSVRPRPSTSW